MSNKQHNSEFSPEEAEKRFKAALRGALKTPAKPLKEKPKMRTKKKPAKRA